MDSYHDLCHMISVAFHKLHVDDNRNDIFFDNMPVCALSCFFHDKRNKIKLQKNVLISREIKKWRLFAIERQWMKSLGNNYERRILEVR